MEKQSKTKQHKKPQVPEISQLNPWVVNMSRQLNVLFHTEYSDSCLFTTLKRLMRLLGPCHSLKYLYVNSPITLTKLVVEVKRIKILKKKKR